MSDTFAPDPELIDGPEILARFLRWAGHPELATKVTDADVAGFRPLRARLRMAFEATSEADAVAHLNQLLAEHPTVSELELVGGAWRFRHRASHPSDVAAALAPECAIALLAKSGTAGGSGSESAPRARAPASTSTSRASGPAATAATSATTG